MCRDSETKPGHATDNECDNIFVFKVYLQPTIFQTNVQMKDDIIEYQLLGMLRGNLVRAIVFENLSRQNQSCNFMSLPFFFALNSVDDPFLLQYILRIVTKTPK